MKNYTIVLVDRHPIVRAGIRGMFGTGSGIDVVGEASTYPEALALVQSKQPDLVCLGLNLPEGGSTSLAKAIHESELNAQVVVFGDCTSDVGFFELLAYGTAGYISKADDPSLIIEAVKYIVEGEKGWVSPRVSSRLVKKRFYGSEETIDELTARQREVLSLIANGYTNSAIAEKLFVSNSTVKNHITTLFSKLGVHSRGEAIAWAWRTGFARDQAQ